MTENNTKIISINLPTVRTVMLNKIYGNKYKLSIEHRDKEKEGERKTETSDSIRGKGRRKENRPSIKASKLQKCMIS